MQNQKQERKWALQLVLKGAWSRGFRRFLVIVFEHLKEHINLISLRENKPWPLNIDLMSTR